MLEKLQMKADRPWKRVILCTVSGYFSYDVSETAGSLTYYMIFAIFPFLIFITTLLGFLNLPTLSFEGEAALLPTDVITLINLTISHMNQSGSDTWLAFGLMFTLWFPFRAMRSMVLAVGNIYGEGKIVKHTWRAILLTILVIVFIPILILLFLVGDGVLQFISLFLPLADTFIQIWVKVRYLPITLGILGLICWVYALSLKERVPNKFILPGAVLATTAWLLFSVVFAYYVNHLGRYSIIYGSIGSIIAFLVWLNISLMALLMGAVFNQALRDELQ